MLSAETRQKIQEILERISNSKEVSLQERKYLQKFADTDQTVSNWLHQARLKQQGNENCDSIQHLLEGLTLGSPDPKDFHKKEDDLGEFFLGAPSWLGRS